MATVKSNDDSRAKYIRTFEWLFWLQAEWKW